MIRRNKDRVPGLDVHRDSVTPCARVVEASEVFEDKEQFKRRCLASPPWGRGR